MYQKSITTLLAASTVFASSLFAGPYAPQSGDLVISTSISHTTFDQFFAGSVRQAGVPGGGEIERTSYRVYAAYGLSDDFAVDLSLGYADVSSVFSQNGDVTDSHLGLSWIIQDEEGTGFDWMARLGVGIAGDYETGRLSAPGDGANSIDFMTKFGKTFSDGGIRGDVELGYTINEGQVPESFRLRAGPSIPLGAGFNFDASGIYFTAFDGIDIGGEGFTGLGDLPLVEERGTAAEIGLSYAAGNAYYRASVSQLLNGRNIGEEFTFGIFSSFRF